MRSTFWPTSWVPLESSTYKYHFWEAPALLGKPSLEESQFGPTGPPSFNIAKYKCRFVAHPKAPLFRTLVFLFVYFKTICSCIWSSFLFSPATPGGGNPLVCFMKAMHSTKLPCDVKSPCLQGHLARIIPSPTPLHRLELVVSRYGRGGFLTNEHGRYLLFNK